MRVEQDNRLDHLTDKERQVVADFVKRVRQHFDGQLLSAVLFGSRARGEAEADPDMDVLVVMFHAGPEIRKEIRYLAVEVWLERRIVSQSVFFRVHPCPISPAPTARPSCPSRTAPRPPASPR